MKSWVIVVALQMGFSSYAQCLRIEGIVRNVSTGQSIDKATIYIHKRTERTALVEQVVTGDFLLDQHCNVKELEIRAVGFYPLKLPLLATPTTNGSYFVPLLLTPVDRQLTDQPYAQSAQKDYLMTGKNQSTANRATRLFKVVDAISGSNLAASLSFYFTKSGMKKHLLIHQGQKAVTVVFKETDIIAIEVNATGYDAYRGNLILDRLDNRTQTYVLRLSRAQTILSVYQVDSTRQLRAVWRPGIGQMVSFQTKGAQYQYLIVPAGSSGQIEVRDHENRLVNVWNVAPAPGLFCYATDAQEKPFSSTFDTPADWPVIYFDQSEYKLRQDMRPRLDSLAFWLKHHTDTIVRITGHTDNVGNAQLNQTLSEFRARVVSQYLQNQGVQAHQLVCLGMGNKKPAALNDKEVNKSLNRRVTVELVLSGND